MDDAVIDVLADPERQQDELRRNHRHRRGDRMCNSGGIAVVELAEHERAEAPREAQALGRIEQAEVQRLGAQVRQRGDVLGSPRG
ncbi:hypothetical protein, partial [Nannocystis pusilla]|uniref:hypothetical protein n=1 Tax=Nannocystis pusilla TaxID=889268 RepID=UPI003BF3C3AA